MGLVERMKDCRLPKRLLVCKPVSGKSSAGGQKRRWNDVLMEDLKRCDLHVLEEWKETPEDRGAWSCLMVEALTDLNDHMKKTREGKEGCQEEKERERCAIRVPLALKYKAAGCGFVGQAEPYVAETWEDGQGDREMSLL